MNKNQRARLKAKIVHNKSGKKPLPAPLAPPHPVMLSRPAAKPASAPTDARDQRFAARGRLPEGSYYEMAGWDGTVWRTSLTVPGAPTFVGTHSGLFRLLENLDTMYREWLERQVKT